MKKLNMFGVPSGTKWENIWFVILNQPYIINSIQNGRAIVIVVIRWLVEVKMYGNRPIILFHRIIQNRVKKIEIVLKFILDRLFFNSFEIYFDIKK